MKSISAVQRRNDRMFAMFERARASKAIDMHAEMLTALKRARFILESPAIAHLVNGAGTLDLVRGAIAKADKW